jgi:uncharacterized membrane protein YccC
MLVGPPSLSRSVPCRPSENSLNKGLLRLSGTLLGSLAAITLIALFPQDRWLFLIGMSIFTGLCTYMMPSTSRWYFWMVAGYTVPLVALSGGGDPWKQRWVS